MSFKAELRVSLGWNWNDGAVDDGRLAVVGQLLGGNQANQAEAVWHTQQQTLLEGASTTLDLTALSRTVLDDLHTVTFLAVKALLIVNHGGGTLLIGDALDDQWAAPFGADGDQIAVEPGSPLLLANLGAGWAVDNSNRNLRLTATGGEVDYSIALVGTTTVSAGDSSSTSGSSGV